MKRQIKQKIALKKNLRRYAIMGALVLLFSLLFSVLYTTFIASPKKELQAQMQARELEYMRLQYQILSDKLDDMEDLLGDLEKRDDKVYRVIFEADPIPNSVRRAGYGGVDRYENLYGHTNSELVVNTSKKLDMMASRLYVQSKSYDEVFKMASRKVEMLKCIPAILPVKETEVKYVSSYFGYRPDPISKLTKFHSGMDFSAETGTKVYAPGDGVVLSADNANLGYGNMITIDHGYGYKTRYAHLNKFVVREGQQVKRGQLIGYVGSTGKSTGAHLHYEVLKDDVQVDPIHFFYNNLTPEQYDLMLEQSEEPSLTMD